MPRAGAAQHPAAPVGGAQLPEFLMREGGHACERATARASRQSVRVRAQGGAAPAARHSTPIPMARLLEIPAEDALATRDRAIMELLYSSGLRLAELVGLESAGPECRRSHGAGARQGQQDARHAGRPQSPVQALRPGSRSARALLAGRTRRCSSAATGRRLGPRADAETGRVLGACARGCRMHVHPHLFRHSFASHLLESSGELRGVQELLGHADISTTQVYTHLDFQHLARIYDATHPRRA